MAAACHIALGVKQGAIFETKFHLLDYRSTLTGRRAMSGKSPAAAPPRRGRRPRVEPAQPTGYRATDTIRRQLLAACSLDEHRNLQQVIDAAVLHYLEHLRETQPSFRRASDEILRARAKTAVSKSTPPDTAKRASARETRNT